MWRGICFILDGSELYLIYIMYLTITLHSLKIHVHSNSFVPPPHLPLSESLFRYMPLADYNSHWCCPVSAEFYVYKHIENTS